MPLNQSSGGEREAGEHFEALNEPGPSGLAANYELVGDTAWVDEKVVSVLESLLFAAGEPVSLAQLANALEEVPRERIRKLLGEMGAAYKSSGRGLVLEQIAGGYQLRTRSDHAAYVRRLLSAKPPRLSRPVLETVAIVAYRQPITRPEIEQLRGVDCGGVLDTLIERNLIKIAGRKDGPGRPIMYMTTPEFLELFGLKDLESLPDLEEFRELEGLRESSEAPHELLPAGTTHADTASELQPDSESATQSLRTEAGQSGIGPANRAIDAVNSPQVTCSGNPSTTTGSREALDPENSGSDD